MNLQRILGGRPPYPIYGFHSEDQMRAYARAAVDAALEAAAVKAASFATCPCNGDSGRCLENETPNAIAAAIRAMRSGVEHI
jgi:hypothetical protein